MKHIIAFLLTIATFFGVQAQSAFVGKWEGTLVVEGMKMNVAFNISQAADGTLTATFDSPDQGASGIKCDNVAASDSTITIKINAAKITYNGALQSKEYMTGTFEQYGMNFDLDLMRASEDLTSASTRPQEPQPPFPYRQEEVTFSHDGITLAGTLTLPELDPENKKEQKYPAVVLISGSGAQDRDENILGHKPFLLLADYLTRKGFAVLRYDDRGVGGSGPVKGNETTVELASDAMAALKYLSSRKDIEKKKIGFLGHSEGGEIAIINAAEHKKDVAFIITLAAPALKGKDIMVDQNCMIMESMGQNVTPEMRQKFDKLFTIIENSTDSLQLATQLLSMEEEFAFADIRHQVDILTSPIYVAMIKFDPSPYLKKVDCPFLALNGEWDSQVKAETNLSAISKAVPKAQVIKYEQLNHLFQTSPDQISSLNYGGLEETMSPQVLDDIAKWLKKLFNIYTLEEIEEQNKPAVVEEKEYKDPREQEELNYQDME